MIKNTRLQKIIIIGGGLSGLTTAFLLKEKGIDATILEANHRLGGRIKSNKTKDHFIMELGATWVFEDHYQLKKLLSKLDISLYEQFQTGFGLFERQKGIKAEKFNTVQMTGGVSYHKVNGGTQVIIDKLSNTLNIEKIHLNTVVTTITDQNENVSVATNKDHVFLADKVIICLPPLLLQNSISFNPLLSESASHIRHATHTWMGQSSKFTIQYPSPFWRKQNLAGLAVSHVGLVREVQDHVSADHQTFGLLGFLSDEASNLDLKTRAQMVAQDLARIFDNHTPHIDYQDEIWKDHPYTNPQGSHPILSAHQNNGHPLLTTSEMNGKLLFAGAETSSINPGYMEGAIRSAENVIEKLGL